MKNISKVLRVFEGYVIVFKDHDGHCWTVAENGTLYLVDDTNPVHLYDKPTARNLRKHLHNQPDGFYTTGGSKIDRKTMTTFRLQPARCTCTDYDFSED